MGIILKWITKKYNVIVQTGFAWLRIATSGVALWKNNEHLGFIKDGGISLSAERLSAYLKGLYSRD
jgi:hypothetical protein